MGVESRHLALPIEAYDGLTSWGKANDAWIEVSEELAEQALCKALSRRRTFGQGSGGDLLRFGDRDCQSIDRRAADEPDGLAQLDQANSDFRSGLRGRSGGHSACRRLRARLSCSNAAALVSVELCSLTWQRDDLSAANLISAGLFGDGAAAVVVAGAEVEAGGPRVLCSRSSFYPGTQEVMGWAVSEKGFRIVLSPDVPRMVYEHLASDVETFWPTTV